MMDWPMATKQSSAGCILCQVLPLFSMPKIHVSSASNAGMFDGRPIQFFMVKSPCLMCFGEIPMAKSPWRNPHAMVRFAKRQASLLPTFLTNAIGRRPQQGAHDPRRFFGRTSVSWDLARKADQIWYHKMAQDGIKVKEDKNEVSDEKCT